MEKIICPKCGKETLLSLSFCKNCDEKLPQNMETFSLYTSVKPPKRTSLLVWFILMVVVNIFKVLLCRGAIIDHTVGGVVYRGDESLNALVIVYYIVWCIVSIITLISPILLLFKIKLGFYLYAFAKLLIALTVLILMSIGLFSFFELGLASVPFFVFAPVGLAYCLYMLLNSKYKGISYWEQLR